jgi:hypothetical protein
MNELVERRVSRSGKDGEGDITSLCGSWGEESKNTVIRQIEASTHDYYVEEEQPRVRVRVVSEGGRKYLRTTADSTSRNNLDNLPDC